MKHLFSAGFFYLLCMFFFRPSAHAQLTLGAQLRTRTELKDGQGTPLPQGSSPAFFTSQRSRLYAGFSGYRFKLGLTVQDVRIWGQDASTINKVTTQENNGLLVHEAWAEIMLLDTAVKNRNLSLKIGRQEIMYDDSRLLGNLDWAQQGRRHDAAVLKYETGPYTLHLGAAFNQNKENAAGTVYNPTPPGNYTATTNGGTMYKSLEYLYGARKLSAGNISFLFLADQFSKFHADSTGVKIWDKGVHTRMTTGLYFINTFNKLTLTAAGYYQFGKNANAQQLSAGLLSAAFQYQLCKSFSAGLGADYTTGGVNAAGKSHAFDPLYGTPHKFWGYMDYFYVASGFGNRGLQDYYLKTKYKAGPKFLLTGDVHEFYSASDVVANGASLSRRFGTEADLVATYSLTKVISFEAGYSHFWNTASLTSPAVKNVSNAQSNSNWAYVSVNIRPEMIFNK
ncbi:alginate export family protein [Chitinophaga filiformis]|uniref:alginate export family protein n=1 Tax=Chitinophaga filiformis TaxID=104663 RepID=UPI001F40A9F6|nr:alginate export family protein [Chitinophaga filiformis]MCF6402794.1 alginate export family protein [Chitinophaga filiformis]MCF6403288.1 alginate export family protein [Chitinophaga filiformis]